MKNASGTGASGKVARGTSRLRAFVLLSLLLQAPAFVIPACAVITPTINYQGFLLSKITNLPVETPQDIKFVIYDAAAAGTARFTESRCNVKVSKGRYDVEIGSAVPGGLPGSLFTDYTGLWLEIQVDGDGDCAGAYESMTPRVRLQASPYAFNSLYASTASAATTVFKMDIIEALPVTTYGAITISTNLFVQGGISVGDITPGQKLSVAGMVESKGSYPACADPLNFTCGFKFPDGSVQTKAAALTMWDVNGNSLYSINSGNTGIGDKGVGNNLTNPAARLHVSSGIGAAGDMLLVTVGDTGIFRINSLGEVYGGPYYGDGTTLTGILRKAGDTMTGQLTLAASSLTVTSPSGLGSPRLRLLGNVEISSAAASARGGVLVSTHVFLPPGAVYYGNGSGLTDVISTDTTKVLKAGDTMSGPLAVTTLTVTGNAFSVSASTTFLVLNGNTSVGRLTVAQEITGSTINVSAGIFAPFGVISGLQADISQGVRASSASFWAYSGPDAANSYSITTASGIKVNSGVVRSPGGFIGDGSQLSNVTGTDPNRLLKAGDIMTGSLLVRSSLTIHTDGSFLEALTVRDPASNDRFILAVTSGNIGVQLPVATPPSAPLEVNREARVSNAVGSAQMHVYSNSGDSFLHWSDGFYSGSNTNQGALGFLAATRDFVYRAMASDPSGAGFPGAEVFRIRVLPDDFFNYNPVNWQFGLGVSNPQERFHVATNILVSTSAANPILYISTTAGRVSINTASQAHVFTVNGGINAVSSVTARGGYYGDQNGLVKITGDNIYIDGNSGIGTAASAEAVLQVAEKPAAKYTLAVGTHTDPFSPSNNTYDFVVTTWGRVGIGLANFWAEPLSEPAGILQVMKSIRIGAETYGDPEANLSLRPTFGPSYIAWSENTGGGQNKGALGFAGSSNDLVYKAGGATIGSGVEVFRIDTADDGTNFTDWKFGIGTSAPEERFHVAAALRVSAPGENAALFVSTGTGSVGISTGTPKERMHVASTFLVGGDRSSAVLYVSTQSGYTGVGTGFPQAKLDVNGAAQFGTGVNRSTFTAEGFWQPRAMTTAQLHAAGGTPTAIGAVVYNSTINDLCVSSGTAIGQWALVGSKLAFSCY